MGRPSTRGYYKAGQADGDSGMVPGTGPIWLTNVKCSGGPDAVLDCTYDKWGDTGCDHREDIGVCCRGDIVLSAASSQLAVQPFGVKGGQDLQDGGSECCVNAELLEGGFTWDNFAAGTACGGNEEPDEVLGEIHCYFEEALPPAQPEQPELPAPPPYLEPGAFAGYGDKGSTPTPPSGGFDGYGSESGSGSGSGSEFFAGYGDKGSAPTPPTPPNPPSGGGFGGYGSGSGSGSSSGGYGKE